MKRCLIMLLAMLLVLAGCSTRQPVEPPKTEPVETEEMVTKTFQILLSESTHYPDGRKLRKEFEYINYEDANPDSALFFENSEPVGEETYQRDAFGNITQITPSDPELPVQRFELTCDDLGRILEKKVYEGEQHIQTLSYTYDEAGNVLTETSVTDHTEMKETRYNEQNQPVEENVYLDGALQQITIISYGEDGRRMKAETWDANGIFKEMRAFNFDTTVNREQEYLYNNEGNLVNCMTRVFNPSGQMIRLDQFDPQGVLLETIIWRYMPYTVKVPASQA